MPKTRNAYALKGFDSERILQRRYFRDFHFDADKTDAQNLQSLTVAETNSINDMEAKLKTIKAACERLERYRQLIRRHYQTRCDRYNKRKAEALGIKVTELKRSAPTLDYLSAELSCIELEGKFDELYFETEKQIQRRYRQEFSARLKKARKAAGLTQRQLGELIQISPNGYSQYESGRREPSLSTLSRLLKVFSAEQLFGRIKE